MVWSPALVFTGATDCSLFLTIRTGNIGADTVQRYWLWPGQLLLSSNECMEHICWFLIRLLYTLREIVLDL
jgi:hypothetical protein